MKKTTIFTLLGVAIGFLAAMSFCGGSSTVSTAFAKAENNNVSYTIENCISEFSQAKTKKTKKGWQFWHVPKDVSPTFNFKISNVGPQSANHAAHEHVEEEIFYIFEGTAEFSFNGQTKTVGPKSTMFCPSGIPHGIRNAGDKPLTYAVIKANYPAENK